MAIIATSVAITCIFATTASVIATTAIMIVTAVVIGIGTVTATATNSAIGFVSWKCKEAGFNPASLIMF